MIPAFGLDRQPNEFVAHERIIEWGVLPSRSRAHHANSRSN